MKEMNKTDFKNKEIVFMGQCMCVTNCESCSSCVNIPQKCEELKVNVVNEMKSLYD